MFEVFVREQDYNRLRRLNGRDPPRLEELLVTGGELILAGAVGDGTLGAARGYFTLGELAHLNRETRFAQPIIAITNSRAYEKNIYLTPYLKEHLRRNRKSHRNEPEMDPDPFCNPELALARAVRKAFEIYYSDQVKKSAPGDHHLLVYRHMPNH